MEALSQFVEDVTFPRVYCQKTPFCSLSVAVLSIFTGDIDYNSEHFQVCFMRLLECKKGAWSGDRC